MLLAFAFVLQALCSNYLLVFTTYALLASAVVRWRDRCLQGRAAPRRNHRRHSSRTVLVAVLRGQSRSRPGAPRQRRRAIQRDMARLPRDRRPPALRVVEPTVFRGPNGALPRLDRARPRGPGRDLEADDSRPARPHGDRDWRDRLRILIGHGAARLCVASRAPAALERAQECRPMGMAAARRHRDAGRVWRQRPRQAREALRADRPRPAGHRRSHSHAGRLHAGLCHPAPLRSTGNSIGRRHRGVPVLFGSERQPERAVRLCEHALLQAAPERLQQFPPRHLRGSRARAQFISRRSGAGGAESGARHPCARALAGFLTPLRTPGARGDRHDSRSFNSRRKKTASGSIA